MVKEVIRSPRFTGEIKHLDKSYLGRVKKLLVKIIQNPEIGKPMRYARKGTREVYVPPFRLSYAYLPSENKIIIFNLYYKDKQ